MAQIIKHRRGSLEKLSEVTGSLQKGEIVIATGSANLSTTNGSGLAFIVTESGSVQASNRFLMGSSDPAVFSSSTYNGMLKGVPYYASGSKTLFLLGSDGNEAINLVGNIQPFSGSVDTRLGDLEASIGGAGSGVGARVANLETISASYLEFTQSYYTDSSSFDTRISASVATATENSSSTATSLSASNANITALSASVSSVTGEFSSSVATSFSASLAAQIVYSASVATTDNTQTTDITANSASAAGAFASASAFSGSLASTISTLSGSVSTDITALDGRVDKLEASQSAFDTAIELSGSDVTINGNFTVTGTQTIVNSTVVEIGDNIIELNGSGAANGGIYVKDATAPNTATGSLIWDSTNDQWKAGVKDAEVKILLAIGDNVFTSSIQTALSGTFGYDTFDTAISTSFSASVASVTALSTSVDSRLDTIESSIGGGGSLGTRVSNLETISGSYLEFTQSYYTDSSSFDTRISASVASITANSSSSATSFSASLASQTELSASSFSTFAKLSGGNTFTETQTVSGSFNVSGSSNFGGAVAVNNSNMNLTNSSSLNLTSGSSLFVNGNGVISGSIVGIGNVSEFSQSVDSRLDSVEESLGGGGSIGTRVGNLETISASYLAFTQSYFSDSASVATSFSASAASVSNLSASIATTDLENSTSISNVSASVSSVSASFATSIETQFSASAASVTANSASVATSLSASVASVSELSTSVDSRLDSIESSIGTGGSLGTRVSNLETISGSYLEFTQSYYTDSASVDTRISASVFTATINSASSATSFSASLASQTALSASIATTDNAQTGRIEALETYSSSLKTAIELTGSSVTIQGDLLVRGTTTSVNSTTIELGDNIIELNGSGAANGGLYIKDVTSPNLATGSLIWDSTNDQWKAGVKDAESKILLASGDNVFTSSIQTALSGTFGYSTFDTAVSTSFSASAASVTALSASVASITGDFSSSVATSFSASSFTVTQNSASVATSFSASLAAQTALSTSVDSRLDTLEGSGSIQGVGTSNNVSFSSVTASLNVPGGSSTKRLAFRGLTDNIEFIAAPTQSGDIAQWNGTDFVMSNVIDGGSF